MDLVDSLMDLANAAVEGTFGKSVTHVQGGSTYAYLADFQERAEMLALGGQVDFDATMPALDVRKTALDDLELLPRAGDRVTFTVHAESRTYRVTVVRETAPGSVVLLLGERTES